MGDDEYEAPPPFLANGSTFTGSLNRICHVHYITGKVQWFAEADVHYFKLGEEWYLPYPNMIGKNSECDNMHV